MMESSNTKSSSLCDKINCNNYLLRKLAERGLYSAEALAISEGALERARIDLYKDMLEYMPFANAKHYKNTKESILDLDEKQAKNATKICSYYDPTAFVETMIAAVNSYDPSKGAQFTSWFSHLYSQKTSARISHDIYDNKLAPKAIRTLKKIDDYLRSIGETSDTISDSAVEAIAARYGWSKKQLKSAWRIREMQKTTSIDTPIGDEEDAATLGDSIKDSRSMAAFITKEYLSDLHRILAVIHTPDNREYTKLFWSNLFLHPFKDELDGQEAKYAVSPAKYLELYRSLEDELMGLFVLSYLQYCLIMPPEPDSIDHINECESRYPFISKTIAEYKNVSASYVSQQEKKFRQLQEELRKMYM